MKVYQELRISGSPEVLRTIVDDLEQQTTDEWWRDREAETSLGSMPSTMYCFKCTDSEKRPASALWLAPQSSGTLYIANIVPTDKQELSYDEYNAVLADFHQRLLLPATEGKTATVFLSAADEDVEAWMSKSVADLLRRFSSSANKTSGGSHPLDRKRWDAFLVAAHRDRASLDASTLRRWLVESEGWYDDRALKLAIEYETARELLEYYDNAPALTAS